MKYMNRQCNGIHTKNGVGDSDSRLLSATTPFPSKKALNDDFSLGLPFLSLLAENFFSLSSVNYRKRAWVFIEELPMFH